VILSKTQNEAKILTRENPFEDNAVVAEKHDEAWKV
jgi:hypothetical protein